MLTTLARYKTFYGITDTASDAKITMILGMISAEIEAYCGRIFGKDDYTKTCKGTGTEFLILDQSPILTATATENDEEFTDFTIQSGVMLEYTDGVFNTASDYTISYTAGYILPEDATEEVPSTLPLDLENACIVMTSMEIERQGSEHLKTEVIGPLRSDYLQDLPIYLRRRLDAHSRKVI